MSRSFWQLWIWISIFHLAFVSMTGATAVLRLLPCRQQSSSELECARSPLPEAVLPIGQMAA